jgi:hypothetical protein
MNPEVGVLDEINCGCGGTEKRGCFAGGFT